MNLRRDQWPLFHLNNRENNALIRVKRASGTCETITNQLTEISWEAPKQRKSGAENVFKEIMADTPHILVKHINLLIQ